MTKESNSNLPDFKAQAESRTTTYEIVDVDALNAEEEVECTPPIARSSAAHPPPSQPSHPPIDSHGLPDFKAQANSHSVEALDLKRTLPPITRPSASHLPAAGAPSPTMCPPLVDCHDLPDHKVKVNGLSVEAQAGASLGTAQSGIISPSSPAAGLVRPNCKDQVCNVTQEEGLLHKQTRQTKSSK